MYVCVCVNKCCFEKRAGIIKKRVKWKRDQESLKRINEAKFKTNAHSLYLVSIRTTKINIESWEGKNQKYKKKLTDGLRMRDS